MLGRASSMPIPDESALGQQRGGTPCRGCVRETAETHSRFRGQESLQQKFNLLLSSVNPRDRSEGLRDLTRKH